VVNGEFIKFFERNFNPAALVVPATMRQAIACQMLLHKVPQTNKSLLAASREMTLFQFNI